MKKLFCISLLATALMSGLNSHAQEDKSKRPSPPALVTQKLAGGAAVSIDYSQPSVKGRTIGEDLEPKDGQVWRTGANEATVFETDKDINVAGQKLPAGKYGLFTLFCGDDVTVIFNKTWKQWGAFKYNQADDFLRIKTTLTREKTPTEMMTFTISEKGAVTLLWGDRRFEFPVK